MDWGWMTFGNVSRIGNAVVGELRVQLSELFHWWCVTCGKELVRRSGCWLSLDILVAGLQQREPNVLGRAAKVW